jgi:hypothetical protein
MSQEEVRAAGRSTLASPFMFGLFFAAGIGVGCWYEQAYGLAQGRRLVGDAYLVSGDLRHWDVFDYGIAQAVDSEFTHQFADHDGQSWTMNYGISVAAKHPVIVFDIGKSGRSNILAIDIQELHEAAEAWRHEQEDAAASIDDYQEFAVKKASPRIAAWLDIHLPKK